MPHYAFLAETPLRSDDIQDAHAHAATVGVPYTDEQIADARPTCRRRPIRRPTARSCWQAVSRRPMSSPATAKRSTEVDALVAYLQMLGTLVNFADTNTERLQQ